MSARRNEPRKEPRSAIDKKEKQRMKERKKERKEIPPYRGGVIQDMQTDGQTVFSQTIQRKIHSHEVNRAASIRYVNQVLVM